VAAKPDAGVTGGSPQGFETRVAVPVAAALVAALLLTGTGVVLARTRGATPAGAAVVGDVATGKTAAPVTPAAPAGPPLRVRIPAIGVDSSLVPLGLNPDRTLEVPDWEEAGWYSGASRPGDPGPAVIAAHVDSTSGPAVFYRLKELKPGDVVHVDYRDASVTFSIRESRSFPKTAFPTAAVYDRTDGPELRLITCDGTFDRQARSYRSNLVVWADVMEPGVPTRPASAPGAADRR
jgi:LPXTG-site transpeptidase (sortase) family protein